MTDQPTDGRTKRGLESRSTRLKTILQTNWPTHFEKRQAHMTKRHKETNQAKLASLRNYELNQQIINILKI